MRRSYGQRRRWLFGCNALEKLERTTWTGIGHSCYHGADLSSICAGAQLRSLIFIGGITMPRPLFDSPYLFGLHDPGGESIMAAAGRRGWVLFTEAVGSDPNNTSGGNYTPWSSQDFGIMCRINHGYGSVGTLPVPARYPDFARRVANFVAASPGCKIWIIGNEMNHRQEWPEAAAGVRTAANMAAASEEFVVGPAADPFGHGSESRFSALAPQPAALDTPPRQSERVAAAAARSALVPITPSDYVRCFQLCRAAIKALPGHADDQVIVGAVAPWNINTTYPGNPTGNWIQYFADILASLGPGGCDGIALHTYTHGSDPALIYDTSTMNPPFQAYYYNFLAYRNFMAAIPAAMRQLPVYITETDQDVPWLDANNGWVQAAYAEINWWNQQPGNQQIRALILYRWPRLDQWYIEGKNGVIQGFREAMANDYRWKEPSPRPASYKVGDVVRTLSIVNVRAAPAGQILGQLPVDTQVTVRNAQYAMVGGLPYWAVRTMLNDRVIDGWIAQYTLDGISLLALVAFGSLRPAAYQAGEFVRTLDVVNLRALPAGQVLRQLPQGTVLTIRDAIFVMAGGVPHWSVRGSLNGATVEGWVAQYTTNGIVLLESHSSVVPPVGGAAADFSPGDTVRTTTAVRMRQTPGVAGKPATDTVALVPSGAALTVLAGPESVERLTWWRLSWRAPDGRLLTGWMAQMLANGDVLLELVVPEAPAQPAPPPVYTFTPGDRFATTTSVRLRRTPGIRSEPGHVIAQITAGQEGVVLSGPEARDTLLWWQVRISDPSGRLQQGWMAERTAQGATLMVMVSDTDTPPDTFRLRDLVQTADFVNVRRAPGVANKPDGDVLGAFLPKSTVVILDGSERMDGLTWWRVGGILVPGGEIRGWVTEATPAAGVLLRYATKLPNTDIPEPLTGVYLQAPYAGIFDISQLWGENAAYYSNFSYDGTPLLGHNGVDFWIPEGTPMQATAAASVLRVGFEAGGFGNFVLLRHAWGESIYAHLSGVDVSQGQKLAAGQVFGRSGNTGGSTGPHLHFAIRINPYRRTDGWGGFSDPLPYLPPNSYRLPSYILAQAARSLAMSQPVLAAGQRMAPSSMGNLPSELRP